MDLRLAALVIVFSLMGSLLGAFSGLVPGIHVNTLALLLLIAYPSMEAAVSAFAPEGALLVSAIIVAASVTHSFLDFVPSVFIGAPEEGTVLSVLPGHRLLLQGRGMEAVACAAQGSLIGACAAVLMAVPLQVAMMHGAYDLVSARVPLLLSGVLLILLLSEARGGWGRVPWAAAVTLTSGLLGIAVLEGELPLPSGMGEELFPLLSGLFGMPALLQSAGQRAVPEQRADLVPVPRTGSALRGVLAGAMVGWLPGVTSTAGTVVASLLGGKGDARGFITMVSSVGTSATVFSLVTLAVIFKGRTGTMVVVSDLLDETATVAFPSAPLAYLLLSALVASAVGHRLTVASGRAVARRAGGSDPRGITALISISMVALVLLLTGLEGLVILAVSTLLGLVPPAAGVSRVHLSSCLLVPVVLFYLDADVSVLL